MKRREFVRAMAVAGAYPLVGSATVTGPWASPQASPSPRGGSARLDTGWRFTRGDPEGAASPALDDGTWEPVVLPHTARIEALVTGEPGSPTAQWQGICWYRRPLRIPVEAAGKKVYLEFEAAMNVAEAFLDGERIGGHAGGFLPFVLDLTGLVQPGRTSLLAVRLDNADNPITGPKPLPLLDFNTYGGLYRYVRLVVKDRLHITDPILADEPASGGVFVRYPEASHERAVVRVQTHVANEYDDPRTFRVRTTLVDDGDQEAARAVSGPVTLASGEARAVVLEITVDAPRLWSPAEPSLYTLRSDVLAAGPGPGVVDAEETRIGLRRIEVSVDGGFRINGERMFLRGTNRHQEYPYVGYALPAAAQRRDARRIKDAGFDYIRLSHYPQAPAFMDACDELGLVVMDCLPGWQYFGKDPAFAELQYRRTRELLRRDRNHPCVVLWEVSLNETAMPPEFISKTQAIAHEEYPGDQMVTCGWVRGYDVLIRARQHGGCAGIEDVPCLVSEYGDWEYYAMTAGFDQQDYAALSSDASNSRQLRWQGEAAMLQQATNFQEAHDDNLASPAFADGLWVMFDYNRGYAPDIESSGCMDLFRLPKYSYWFFRSQRSPHERLARAASGPMVFIASEWTPASSTVVRVFSNCEQVELRLNGVRVGRQGPDRDRKSRHLAHPPFTFHARDFVPGTLEAVGYMDGRPAASHTLRTPGPVERLGVSFDLTPPDTTGKDLLFCRARLEDAAGTVVPDAWENVAFGATGDGRLVGTDPFSSDAGIASILLETPPEMESAAVYALSIIRGPEGAARVLAGAAALPMQALGSAAGPARSPSAAGSPEGPGSGEPAPPYDVRFTTDGSEPGPASPRYAAPIAAEGPVRAALLVEGRVVASLDERTERFRIRGSSAPPRRTPFRHTNPGPE